MFEVGDIITGIEKGLHYSITDSDAVCRVIDVYGDSFIKVEVIDHKTMPSTIGDTYDVDGKHFILLRSDVQLEPQSNDDFMEMLQ